MRAIHACSLDYGAAVTLVEIDISGIDNVEDPTQGPGPDDALLSLARRWGR
jgi:hypothetical protein